MKIFGEVMGKSLVSCFLTHGVDCILLSFVSLFCSSWSWLLIKLLNWCVQSFCRMSVICIVFASACSMQQNMRVGLLTKCENAV